MTDGNADTAKVVELIGESDESWEDAATNAVRDACETIEGVNGVKIINHTAEIEDNEITRYRATVHVSFPVKR